MNAAKTASERVAKLRADRDALGLKRLELYAHPEDWPAIKALAEEVRNVGAQSWRLCHGLLNAQGSTAAAGQNSPL